MSGAGSLLQVIGGIKQAQAYHAAGKYNQAVADRNALYATRDAVSQESDVREQVRSAIGQQIVSQAGSGFQMGTGTQLDALVESQVNGMLDALRIRRQGQMTAQGYQQQGVLAKMSAKQSETAAYFGAAAAAANSGADYAAAGG